MTHLERTLPPAPPEERTAELLGKQYITVRQQTAGLAAMLSAEDQMVQSCPEASPAKWHQAHTSWFFETFVLSDYLPGYRPFEPHFRDLFNSYYNAVGQQPDKAIRSTFSRPTLEEIRQYRAHVDERMLELLHSKGATGAVQKLVTLGLNHEQQHQELLVTDIKHAFWSNPLRPAYHPATAAVPVSGAVPQKEPQLFPEGLYEIGAAEGEFYFDNEASRHKVYTQAFRIGMRLVTCGEYLSFMEDHGYLRPELWLSEGWKTVQSRQWSAPLYWKKVDGHWFQFTCSGMRKVEESEPICHISYYEAAAFACWAGARLPTEFEWEIAASKLKVQGNLLENGRFHPAAAAPAKEDGPMQIFGDVWEWTASAFLPYPGYKPAAGALGEYNAKFMSNQMVLRGGSCVTPRSHIRASYRNFFPPETRWQFSGLRLADDGN
ncbi:MAG TPA: ergothioneine biosynthesis protein EgtB [Candidatus Saccharimonadales bacterium]|nr:ergothioneine biosynthesis protein EgtB [Candidatus Saccharimonadales bacterium]